jgi:tetratricopeptide (TPR) repeat protein
MASSAPAETKKQELARRADEAVALAGSLLVMDPHNPDALHTMGLAFMAEAKWDQAVTALGRALKADPERPETRANFAQALDRQAKVLADARDYAGAAALLERAIDLETGDSRFYPHIAFVLAQMKCFPAAHAVAEAAVGMAPDSADAHDALGVALAGLKRTEEARQSYERALEIDPQLSSARTNLGNLFKSEGELEAAMDELERAVLLDAESARAHGNLGIARMAGGDLQGAEDALRRAIEIDPEFAEAHYNLSMVLLMAGQFKAGWEKYEWRWRCPDFPSTRRDFPYPRWQGEALSGRTLLIWSEQGVGDEIMFANAIPTVMDSGAKVVIECNPRFKPLFARSFAGALVVERADPPDPAIAAARIDFQISAGSLSRHLRPSKAAFPLAPGFYLRAEQARAHALRERYDACGEGLMIGISWRSANPVVGGERSAPLTLWDDLLTRPGCVFVNLQYGEVADELAETRERLGVTIHRDAEIDPLASMDDWAAQIAAMDLVISVDNSTVQLSGALGIPTWTLLTRVPEWRWLMDGDESPWHPLIRIFRQPAPGDWATVFTDVLRALDRELGG